MNRHAKDKRYPEMVACAKALKGELGFKKVGAIGFCWGGWAVFQLGGKGASITPPSPLPFKSHQSTSLRKKRERKKGSNRPLGENLVDCISTAHPSLLTKEEINNVAVPVQVLAPEHDPQLTPELKAHCNATIPTLNVAYDYQYFPGLAHGFAAKGDPKDDVQRKGLERAKNAAVGWFAQFLHLH